MSGSTPSGVIYREIHGRLEGGSGPAPTTDLVVVSSLTKAHATSPAMPGLIVRYVAEGIENYHIGSAVHRLREGELMICAQPQSVRAEIDTRGPSATLGLCVALQQPGSVHDILDLERPIIVSARHGQFGELLRSSLDRLLNSRHKQRDAAATVHDIETSLPGFSEQLARELSGMSCARAATRIDALRKVSVARDYLHGVVDRPVPLPELARVAGISRFHLLRLFKSCFDETPGAYHRKLRLRLAAERARESHLSLSDVADHYGFAGGSSFSHAYRRAFGHAPSRDSSRVAHGD